jgi:hypothetical protein
MDQPPFERTGSNLQISICPATAQKSTIRHKSRQPKSEKCRILSHSVAFARLGERTAPVLAYRL